MAEKERVYTIPLRRVWVEVPRVRRANRSVSEIKRFLSRHMHAENVQISKALNEIIWKRGAKKPPAKLKVKARLEDNVVKAMLPEEKEPAKEEKKGGKLGGIKEKLAKAGIVEQEVKEIEKKAEQAVVEKGKVAEEKGKETKEGGEEIKQTAEEKQNEGKKV